MFETALLYHLQTFHQVAVERSFTRAARKLHLSQPAVSMHVRSLERHYGAPLFDVRHRRVYLTPEGETLLGYTSRLFALLRDAGAAVAETRALERGRLAIAASTTIGVYLLPALLSDFSKRYPGIRLSLTIGTSAAVLAQVLAEQVPFGMVEAPVTQPGVEVWPFADDALVLVVPPDHPWASAGQIELEQLRGARVLRREAGAGTRSLIDAALERAGITVETAMELGSPEALKQAVMAGLGITWLSRLAAQRELASGALVAITTPGLELKRTLSVIIARGRRLPRAAQAFLDEVVRLRRP